MGYTYVLILNSDINFNNSSYGSYAQLLISAMHSHGIKTILHITPKDIVDKDVYIHSIIDRIKESSADGLMLDLPYVKYCDKSLIKQINDSVHEKFSSFITIADLNLATECSDCTFDFIINQELLTRSSNFLAIDPYFRSCIQSEYEKAIFNVKKEYIVPFSYFDNVTESNPPFLTPFGNFEDKLDQKRAINLLLLTIYGKTVTIMGDEFEGARSNSGALDVNWKALESEHHQDMRLFTRSLNYFYLSTPILNSSKDVTVAQYSGVDITKNIIAVSRVSNSDRIMTIVNLSGIEQSFDLALDYNVECIFATHQYIGQESVKKNSSFNNVYTFTLPKFSGATYRL